VPRQDSVRVLTVDEACEFLKVTRWWLIKEGVAKRKVPFIRPPGSNQIKFLESDLIDVLKSWRVGYSVGSPPKEKKSRRKVKAKVRR
jgi:hypothetical protein